MHRAVNKTYNIQRGYLPCRAGQHKAPRLAAPTLYKTATPQLVKDIFEKTRGNGLGIGYFLNARGAAARAPGKLKEGAQTVLALK